MSSRFPHIESVLRSFPWPSGAPLHGQAAFEYPFIHGWTSELLSDHFLAGAKDMYLLVVCVCVCMEVGFHFSHLYTHEWGLQKLLFKTR